MRHKAQIYIEFIMDILRTGNIDRPFVFNEFSKKWQNVSERTFHRYWIQAKDRFYSSKNKSIIDAEEEYNNTIKENTFKDLLTIDRKREILKGIIEGSTKLKKVVISDGIPIEVDTIPDMADRLKALDLDNKMAGHYAPAKVARTDVQGNDVPNDFERLILESPGIKKSRKIEQSN